MRLHLIRAITGLVVLGAALGAALVAALLVGATMPSTRTDSSQYPLPTLSTLSTVPGATASIVAATPSGTSGAAVLIGAGDIATCDRFEDELTANVVEKVTGAVFTLGDNAYPDGSRASFHDCYGPSWGRPSILERTRPAVGETEYKTPDASAYFEYFGAAAGDPKTGYYAYDVGTWRVYVLNSNCRYIGRCAAGTPQEKWLRADLAANPRRCVLAMWHSPFFTSGNSRGATTMRDIWKDLQDAGAELVLSGDDHVYERFAPQTSAGDPSDKGIVQFIVGTGGARPEDFLYEAPNSLVRGARVSGVLRLELSPGSYSFEFLAVAGRQFSDNGSGTCH